MIKPQSNSTESDTPPSAVSPDVEETFAATDAPAEEISLDVSDETNEAVSESENSEEDEVAKFQGIGTLYGNITQDEEQGFFIKLGQNQYRLYILRNRYRSWLLQMKNAPDTPLYLRVYPKYRIIPRQPPEVYFQVVAWVEENQWEEPGIFILKGIWQFIPQIRTPVISIYRNSDASDPTEKFKAVHLPVLMRREDETRPFKFNPKIPKEQLPKRWFIQAEYKFIPSRDCWGWVKDLDTPTDHIPRYRKPVKPQEDSSSSFKPERKYQADTSASESEKPKKSADKPKINHKLSNQSEETS